jgi:hypothetical protein
MKTPVTPLPNEETKKIAREVSKLAEEISLENKEIVFRFEREAKQYAIEKTAKNSRVLRFLIRAGLLRASKVSSP